MCTHTLHGYAPVDITCVHAHTNPAPEACVHTFHRSVHTTSTLPRELRVVCSHKQVCGCTCLALYPELPVHTCTSPRSQAGWTAPEGSSWLLYGSYHGQRRLDSCHWDSGPERQQGSVLGDKNTIHSALLGHKPRSQQSPHLPPDWLTFLCHPEWASRELGTWLCVGRGPVGSVQSWGVLRGEHSSLVMNIMSAETNGPTSYSVYVK